MGLFEHTLMQANIPLEGLFMNADAGFDAQELRDWAEKKGIQANVCIHKRNSKNKDREGYYFDELLYKQRFVAEKTNAWIDGFKAFNVV